MTNYTLIAVSYKSLRDTLDHINFYKILKINDAYELFTYKINAISTNLLDPYDTDGHVRPEVVFEPVMQGNSFVWIRTTNDDQYVTS